MIQEIFPHRFNNHYLANKNIGEKDFVLHYNGNSLLLKTSLQLFMAALLLVIWSNGIAGAVDFSQKKPAQSMIQLSIQRYPMPSDETSQGIEQGSVLSQELITLDLNRTALLLVDVWKTHEQHSDNEWLDKKQTNIEQKIVPLLAFARRHRLMIIHLPHRQEIADEATPLPGEIVCTPRDPDELQHELLGVLQEHQVTTLLYAGYNSNLCVLFRPTGILAMRTLGYQTILIRDCTIAFVPQNFTSQEERAFLNQFEPLWGITTTLDDVQHALQSLKMPNSDLVLEDTMEGKKREQEKIEEYILTR